MNAINKYPLISCLCVTHEKPKMLERVINCFYNQSYQNKQLIIVYEDFDTLTHEFIINQYFENNIKVIMIDSSKKKIPLGELRNTSIYEADGEYVCQWDDDDWFDPDRLATQMLFIQQSGKPACILSRWIVFDALTSKAYLSNQRLWEGSILCRKDLMLEKLYPALHKGEDSSVVEHLYQNEKLYIVDDMPELYIYISHGNNTWEQRHFDQIFQFSTELPSEYSLEIQEILREPVVH